MRLRKEEFKIVVICERTINGNIIIIYSTWFEKVRTLGTFRFVKIYKNNIFSFTLEWKNDNI